MTGGDEIWKALTSDRLQITSELFDDSVRSVLVPISALLDINAAGERALAAALDGDVTGDVIAGDDDIWNELTEMSKSLAGVHPLPVLPRLSVFLFDEVLLASNTFTSRCLFASETLF